MKIETILKQLHLERKGKKTRCALKLKSSSSFFLFYARLKLRKSCFVLKIMRSLLFVVLKKNFYSNYDSAQRPSDGARGSEGAMKMWKWSIMLLSLWKNFFIYRRMMCALRCCFVLSDIIVVMGCLVIELKMLFLAFLLYRVLLLNLKCFLSRMLNSRNEENMLKTFNWSLREVVGYLNGEI